MVPFAFWQYLKIKKDRVRYPILRQLITTSTAKSS